MKQFHDKTFNDASNIKVNIAICKFKLFFFFTLFKSLLLIGLTNGTYTTNHDTEAKVTSNELGLYFMLPAGLLRLLRRKWIALVNRGKKL